MSATWTFAFAEPGTTFSTVGSSPEVNYTTLRKRADWSRVYSWDFSDFEEIVAGETIASASIAAVTGLTIGATSISGAYVRANLSGGTAGSEYRITCVIVTSGGKTLSIVGILDILS